ncbi:restriction endonuclease subunit S [Sorangium sp. So ce1078]|uniref:restriction endonuclease subunit S n=1 Tax=Sorangium sp. So ce1078 TaxID=3133329 RepID=UPI003F5EBA21
MSNTWREVSLEDVAREVTVGYVGPMASEYVPHGVPFLRSQNVEQLRINTDDMRFISPPFHSRLKKSALSPGDVVIVRTGKPGICAVIPEDLKVANCSDLIIVRCGPELDPRFLAYFVNSSAAAHVDAHLVGAVQQHFNVASARAMRIRLPSFQEQRAIVRILGALDTKIELHRRTSETLGAMARAIFQSWFVDFEGQGELVDGRMPRGWSSSTLQHHVTLQRGTTYSGNLVGLPGPALLGLGSIEPGGGFRDGHYKTYGGECPEKLMLFPGDLFVALKGATKDGSMVGSIARVPPSVASGRLTQDTVKLQFMKPDSGIECYVYWLLRMPHFRTYCAGRITGSAQVGLSRDDFLSYPVPLPPDTLLAAFSKIESSLSRRQDLLAAECKSLADLRDTLLPKLLSGELRVPEAEHAAKL